MLKIVVAVLVCAAVAAALSDEEPVLSESLVSEVNAAGAGWTAGFSKRFHGLTVRDAKRMLGALLTNGTGAAADNRATAFPDQFDSRTQWPNCIHPVRDQGHCGSCWAFGATEALSDRFCVQAQVNVILSPQDLVSCERDQYGCGGGYLDRAWNYMASTGVVSEDCFPYQSGGGQTPACPGSRCTSGSPFKKYRAKSPRQVNSNQESIKGELYTRGPTEVAFEVYQDFIHYTSGVYKHTSGGLLGGHAVKLIGWGVESGSPYWLCQNSWGPSWGAGGYFKIYRGTDECGIESNVFTGDASN